MLHLQVSWKKSNSERRRSYSNSDDLAAVYGVVALWRPNVELLEKSGQEEEDFLTSQDLAQTRPLACAKAQQDTTVTQYRTWYNNRL